MSFLYRVDGPAEGILIPHLRQAATLAATFYWHQNLNVLFYRQYIIRTLLVALTILISTIVFSQRPRNGTYTYFIRFKEWDDRTLGATCTVKIKGDSILILRNSKTRLSSNNGNILEEGIIMRHKKTGKWIIGHSADDIYAAEIGGCGVSPTIIDFKNKFWRICS